MDGVASQPRMRKPRPIASNTRRGRFDPFSEASRAGAPRPLPAGRHGHRKRLRKRRLGARLWLLHAKKQHRAHRQASQPADRATSKPASTPPWSEERSNDVVLEVFLGLSVPAGVVSGFNAGRRRPPPSYRGASLLVCLPAASNRRGHCAPRQCTDGGQHGQQPRRTLSVVTAGQGVVGGGSFLSRVVVCSFFE